MAKRKKSTVKSGSKSKLARTGQSQSSQASRLDDSWSSLEQSDVESSKTSNILISCRVCTQEICIKTLNNIDYLQSCLCSHYFHGECLSINESILPNLHIFDDWWTFRSLISELSLLNVFEITELVLSLGLSSCWLPPRIND